MTEGPLAPAVTAFLRDLRASGRHPRTVAAYRTDLGDLVIWLSKQGVTDWVAVDQPTLIAYLGALQAAGRRPATLRRRVAAIKAFFSARQLRQPTQPNPATLLQAPRVSRPAGALAPLTVAESDRLVATLGNQGSAPVRDRALGAVMVATGARVSEVLSLDWARVNLNLGLVELTGAAARLVPLDRRARAALQALQQEHTGTAVFVNQRGHRLTRQAVWQILRRAGAPAQISGAVTPQRIRDGFAARLLNNGADLTLVQSLLGLQGLVAATEYLNKLREAGTDAG